MRFEIDFTPTKRRPRIKRNGQSYDPKENQREKRAMVAAFKAQCGAVAPLEGAVSVKVDIYRRMPKNRPQKLLREFDTYKPDADNIAKAVLDAMPAVEETQYVRHVRFEHPLRILMDGKKQEGAVLIPTK